MIISRSERQKARKPKPKLRRGPHKSRGVKKDERRKTKDGGEIGTVTVFSLDCRLPSLVRNHEPLPQPYLMYLYLNAYRQQTSATTKHSQELHLLSSFVTSEKPFHPAMIINQVKTYRDRRAGPCLPPSLSDLVWPYFGQVMQ